MILEFAPVDAASVSTPMSERRAHRPHIEQQFFAISLNDNQHSFDSGWTRLRALPHDRLNLLHWWEPSVHCSAARLINFNAFHSTPTTEFICETNSD